MPIKNAPSFKTTAKELEFRLGVMLYGDTGMQAAFKILARTAEQRLFASSLDRVAVKLEQGETLTKGRLIGLLPFFSNRTIDILLSDLKNKTKGKLLTSWNWVDHRVFSIKKGIIISIFSFGIGGFTLLMQLAFVLPQFSEILYGLNVNSPLGNIYIDFEQLSYYLPVLLILFPIFMIVFSGYFAGFLEKLVGGRRLCDRINLYRMLSVIPSEERLNAISSLGASKDVFFDEGAAYKRFADVVLSGNEYDVATGITKLGAHFSWLLSPQETPDSGSGLLESLADMHYAKLVTIRTRVDKAFESFLLLVNGLILGSAVWFVFSSLMAILEGVIP